MLNKNVCLCLIVVFLLACNTTQEEFPDELFNNDSLNSRPKALSTETDIKGNAAIVTKDGVKHYFGSTMDVKITNKNDSVCIYIDNELVKWFDKSTVDVIIEDTTENIINKNTNKRRTKKQI